MKKILKTYLLPLTIALFVLACQEDEPQLGDPIDQSLIEEHIENGDINVIQVSEIDPGGNTVVLTYDVPGTAPLWDYGTGRSQKLHDTVRYAFKGDYLIRLFVTSEGGVVEKQFPITVTEDNLTYVDHPLYDFLTGGGPGHSKTWVFDLRPEDALSTYFNGPVAFAGDQIGWGYECTVEEGNCWNWQPNYQNWSMSLADYGSITFSLDGGPFVTVEQKVAGVDPVGVYEGTYFLDVNALTLTFTGVNTLNYNTSGIFDKATVVEISENGLALAFHDQVKSEYIVLNYVSKEYFDNWVPEEEEDPTAPVNTAFNASTLEGLWKLSAAQTTGWVNWVDGALFDTWATREAMMNVFEGWWTFGDPADTDHVTAAKAGFNETMGLVTVTFSSGTCTIHNATYDHTTDIITETDYSVPYSVTKGVITFESEVKINTINVGLSGVTMHIIDPTNGSDAGIWLGQKNGDKFESAAIHLIKQ